MNELRISVLRLLNNLVRALSIAKSEKRTEAVIELISVGSMVTDIIDEECQRILKAPFPIKKSDKEFLEMFDKARLGIW